MSRWAALELLGFILFFGGWVVYVIDVTRGKTPSSPGWLSTGRGALITAAGEGCWVLNRLIDHNIFGTVLDSLWLAAYLYSYFKNGGGKGLKKAAKELGEKSKAKIQELVDNLQPSPIPSPVGA